VKLVFQLKVVGVVAEAGFLLRSVVEKHQKVKYPQKVKHLQLLEKKHPQKHHQLLQQLHK
jgi:hypothetical protein